MEGLVAKSPAPTKCAECETVNEAEARFCLRCGTPLAIVRLSRDLLRGLKVDANERREFLLQFQNVGGGIAKLELELLGDRTDWANLRNSRLSLKGRAENTVMLEVNGERMEPGRKHRVRLRVRSDSFRGRRTDAGAARTWDRWCRDEQDHTIEVEVKSPPELATNKTRRDLGSLGRGEREYARLFRIGNSGEGALELFLESTAPFLRLTRQEFKLGARQVEDLPAIVNLKELEPGSYEAAIVVRDQKSHHELGRLAVSFQIAITAPDLPVLGVDFGTSSSKIALLGGGGIQQVPLNGSDLFPSHVYIHENGRMVVGEEAGRHVGKPGYVNNLKVLLSHTGAEPPVPGRDVSIRNLVKDFLGRLWGITRVSRQFQDWVVPDPLPTDVRVVATVPAGCQETRAPMMHQILDELGFDQIRVMVESTAASYLYASKDDRIVEGKKLLVFDCGAGTTDVSVLSVRLERNEAGGYYYRVFDILSEVGADIGGNLFDLELYELIVQKMSKDQKENLKRDLARQRAGPAQAAAAAGQGEPSAPEAAPPPQRALQDRLAAASQRLLQEVRKFKEKASASWRDQGEGGFELVCPGIVDSPLLVTRAEVLQRLRPIMENLEELCYAALDKADLTVADVDRVYPVGGSSFLPQVNDLLRKVFGDERLQKDEDRLTCVARGAVAAADTRLRRVLPVSYVCRLEGGRELDLVRRGSIFPIRGGTRNMRVQAPPFQVDMEILERSPDGGELTPVGRIRLDVPEVQYKNQLMVLEFDVDEFGDLDVRAIFDPDGARIQAEMSLPKVAKGG